MLQATYPPALLDAFPPDELDEEAVAAWFMRNTRVGANRARAMATFYCLLSQADPTEKSQHGAASVREVSRRKVAARRAVAPPMQGSASHLGETAHRQPSLDHPSIAPQLHIHFHLPEGASPEIVEQLLVALGKHGFLRR